MIDKSSLVFVDGYLLPLGTSEVERTEEHLTVCIRGIVKPGAIVEVVELDQAPGRFSAVFMGNDAEADDRFLKDANISVVTRLGNYMPQNVEGA